MSTEAPRRDAAGTTLGRAPASSGPGTPEAPDPTREAPPAPGKGGADKPRAFRRTLAILRPHVGGNGRLMAGGVVALLFEVAFRVLEPWPVKFVVDAVTRSLGADLGDGIAGATVQLLAACAAAVVVVVGLRALCNYLSTIAFALAGSRVATSLRQRVFAHVQALPGTFHAGSRTGDTVQRLVGDVGKLQEVAVTAGLPLLANVVTLLAMAGVMFWLDPLLALVVVVAAAAYALLSRGSTSSITGASRKTRKGEGQLANIAQESLGAMRVVHAYGLERELEGRFAGSNQKTLKDGVKAKRLAAGLERRTDVIVGFATAAVLFGGGWRVLDGGMTPGDLVIFLTYLKTAMKPLRDMAKYTGRIARAAASGERVADLLDVPVTIADGPGSRGLARADGRIELRGVRAGYAGGEDVLRGVDLVIPAGQKVAVIGPSGSGKSTLSLLLNRLLEPSAGTVALDGLDLRRITLSSLRSLVGLVPQESVLFNGTIRDNIRYGRLDAGEEEIMDAARRAHAHDFIHEFPDAYDTHVGERGGTLSGGQRQRIAIARAMLRDSAVVVLDEATTGLDPESAGHVLDALERLAEGRTTVSITHDAATALAADRILWMERGRIVLDGSPEQLLSDGDGRFSEWVARQREDDDGAEPPGAAAVPACAAAEPAAEAAVAPAGIPRQSVREGGGR
ncbi:ABC transporter ATP-binding protein [Zafaria sp. Z1313]|uniref:ABC transporter ATP-binding protein n=1 Tax=unclassified Zafaria TaxID=2828765 RepID=UPI002E77BC1F|nr:ABC transporter ATP-binding protein [Zafaria sp. J156]MEE1620622.1 ABC transporter ATP-binding protein [Zafaria sp. J156]